MRQLVVEVPAAGIDPSIASDIKSTLDAATPRALDGLDCYKLGNSRTCWSVETQPTLNRTARSFVFNSAEASKEFATRLVAQPALLAPSSSSSRVALKRQQRARRGPRSYTSFFSRNTPVDGAGKTTDDSDTDLVLDDTWIGDEVNDGLFEKSREDMRSAKWMLFAARAFIMRFYGLAKVCSERDERDGKMLTSRSRAAPTESRLCRHFRHADRVPPHALDFRLAVPQHAPPLSLAPPSISLVRHVARLLRTRVLLPRLHVLPLDGLVPRDSR